MFCFTAGDEPNVVEPLKDQTVLVSETAKFSATLKVGEPRADVSWTKAGKPLKADGKKYLATFDNDTVTLEIVKCETADSAAYGFVASNKIGKISSQATLTVNGEAINEVVFSLLVRLIGLNLSELLCFHSKLVSCNAHQRHSLKLHEMLSWWIGLLLLYFGLVVPLPIRVFDPLNRCVFMIIHSRGTKFNSRQ